MTDFFSFSFLSHFILPLSHYIFWFHSVYLWLCSLMYFSFLLHLRERVRDIDQERKREKRKKSESENEWKRHSLEWIECCMTWVWNGHHHLYWNKLLKKKWSEGNQDEDESERVKIGGGEKKMRNWKRYRGKKLTEREKRRLTGREKRKVNWVFYNQKTTIKVVKFENFFDRFFNWEIFITL